MKAVKSNDPRKPAIVAALKKRSGGTKVTNVEEIGGGDVFRGHCLKPEIIHDGRFTIKTGKFVDLGVIVVIAGEDFEF